MNALQGRQTDTPGAGGPPITTDACVPSDFRQALAADDQQKHTLGVLVFDEGGADGAQLDVHSCSTGAGAHRVTGRCLRFARLDSLTVDTAAASSAAGAKVARSLVERNEKFWVGWRVTSMKLRPFARTLVFLG